MYRLIGCMTGTSCDGLDIAYIITDGIDKLTIGPSLTVPFNDDYQKTLRQRVTMGAARHFMDDELSKNIAKYHVHHIREFIQHNQLEVDAIGFHGQTVWHDPKNGVTVQLGDCQLLANNLGLNVVGQMRLNDVANGGQGAPFAPIYHQVIAKKLPKPVVIINIGGVSNLTFITTDDDLIAGDIGPGNALIDDWMAQKTGIAQDTNGTHAKRGIVIPSILNKWLDNPFFDKSLPKSLDRMYFHQILNDCQNLSVEDGAATLTEFTIQSIVQGVQNLPDQPLQLVICGGGCHNPVIMDGLRKNFENILGVSELGFNEDAIEAQLIAFLAARFFEKLPSSFPKTTGVSEPTVVGQLFLSENHRG